MTNQIETIEYRSWGKVVRINNGTAELLLLTQVGPRILHYGFHGGENQLHEFLDHARLAGDGQYHGYAGHRLWVSPEVERTYYPDNFPVQVTPLA
ncbi:MAG TPA: hypothetical protein VGR48_03985, partial [Terriglobales bacterium]|nr:hypothetical protein [Terriglobales bacterium]